MEAELQKKLLKRAGNLLARRSYSRGEMQIKLSKLAEPADVEETLDRLEALNLLNDLDYAYNFAFSRIRLQGWGPIRVRHSLRHRQVPHQFIEAAIDRVWQDVGDDVVLKEYLDRHCRKTGLPEDRRGIQKLIGHLRRRGFNDATIYSTLRQMIPDVTWECFETGESIV
jgi:regulatory protein